MCIEIGSCYCFVLGVFVFFFFFYFFTFTFTSLHLTFEILGLLCSFSIFPTRLIRLDGFLGTNAFSPYDYMIFDLFDDVGGSTW